MIIHPGRPKHRRIHVSQRAIEVGNRVAVECFGKDLRAESMFGQHAADQIERVQAMAGSASRHKRRQVAVQLFPLRILALKIARELAADCGEQAPIALIETLPQA